MGCPRALRLWKLYGVVRDHLGTCAEKTHLRHLRRYMLWAIWVLWPKVLVVGVGAIERKIGKKWRGRGPARDRLYLESGLCWNWSVRKGLMMFSFGQQDNGTQSYTGEVCYILVNHTALGRKPSGNSSEEEEVTGELYENISCEARRPRESLGGTETEYSLLRVSSPPSHPPCPEDEYELLMPGRVSSSLQQPGPRVTPFETQFSHFQWSDWTVFV